MIDLSQFNNYTSGLFGRIKNTLKTPYVAVIRHSPIKPGENVFVIFKPKAESARQVYRLDGTRVVGNKLGTLKLGAPDLGVIE